MIDTQQEKRTGSSMFDSIQHFENIRPKLKTSLSTISWSFLFFFDSFFNIVSRKKDKDGNVLKKSENKSFYGDLLARNHQKNVDKIIERSSQEEPQLLTLPSVDVKDLNIEEFKKWKDDINIPLVIKGFLKSAPILDKVSGDNLLKEYGEREIMCVANAKSDEYKKKSTVGQNLQGFKTTLKDFLTSEEFDDHYINNTNELLDYEDFLISCKGNELDNMMGSKNIITHWFISRIQNNGSSMHCAGGNNMFLNIRGKKEWYFVPPSYSPVFYPAMSKHGFFCVSEMEEDHKGNYYEDLLKRYPYMKHVPVYRTVLEDGDLLFNPPWWWHRVQNLTPLTIGCATRYNEPKKVVENSRTFAYTASAETLKNPKKSMLWVSFQAMKDRKNGQKIIDALFAKKIDRTKK